MAGNTKKFVKSIIILFELIGPNNFNVGTALKNVGVGRKNVMSIM